MSSNKEIKDIVSKLVVLEEILEPLQRLVADINTLLEQGNSWLKNTERITYKEMKELLKSETVEFLKRCFSIASSGQDTSSETAIMTKENLNQAPQNDILKTIQNKLKNQERSLKTVSKLNLQTEARNEEIMQELQSASHFMTNMSKELNVVKEKIDIHDKMIQEIFLKTAQCLEQKGSVDTAIVEERIEQFGKQIERFTNESDRNINAIKAKDSEICQLKDKQDALQDLMQIKEQVNRILQNDYDKAMKKLTTKKAEIVKLKEENATVLKQKDEEVVRLIKLDDFKKCVKHAIKVERGLDDNGVLAFWLGASGFVIYTNSTPLSRQAYIQWYCLNGSLHLLSGAVLIRAITYALSLIGLSTSEIVAFWDKYGNY